MRRKMKFASAPSSYLTFHWTNVAAGPTCFSIEPGTGGKFGVRSEIDVYVTTYRRSMRFKALRLG
jgi:hypothetical protein